MKLLEKVAKQAGKPTGKLGMLFARSMNRGHIGVTRWGLSHMGINKNDTILDIGCGGGKNIYILASLATEGKIYGIDYSEVSVKVSTALNRRFITSGQVEIVHALVEAIPFPDNMFDLVTAVETYYFWPDLTNNLREIYRVIKPGGSLILINECYQDEKFEKRNTKWAELGGFTCHRPEEFEALLKQAGYSRIQIDTLKKKNWITAIGMKINN